MDETRLGADDLGQMCQEGDDVMLGFALDFIDARDVETGIPALGPDRRSRLARNDAQIGHRIGGMRFDLEPDAVAGLRAPYLSHRLAGVTRDHRQSPQNARNVMMV